MKTSLLCGRRKRLVALGLMMVGTACGLGLAAWLGQGRLEASERAWAEVPAILWNPETWQQRGAVFAGDGRAKDQEARKASTTAARLNYEKAEAELAAYLETMQAAREAVEEAVEMANQQRENYEFALERHERLMPLVETGALDAMTASQIQSALIAARVGLAQAQFFLAQARRELGSEEQRRREYNRLVALKEEARMEYWAARGSDADESNAGKPSRGGLSGREQWVLEVFTVEELPEEGREIQLVFPDGQRVQGRLGPGEGGGKEAVWTALFETGEGRKVRRLFGLRAVVPVKWLREQSGHQAANLAE